MGKTKIEKLWYKIDELEVLLRGNREAHKIVVEIERDVAALRKREIKMRR